MGVLPCAPSAARFCRDRPQADYIQALLKNELVIGLGPAGTGKTYLAVAAATMLVEGKVDRIILSRPAVEAGENLGFLPGDMRDKVDPYLRPLYDALYDMLPGPQVTRSLKAVKLKSPRWPLCAGAPYPIVLSFSTKAKTPRQCR